MLVSCFGSECQCNSLLELFPSLTHFAYLIFDVVISTFSTRGFPTIIIQKIRKAMTKQVWDVSGAHRRRIRRHVCRGEEGGDGFSLDVEGGKEGSTMAPASCVWTLFPFCWGTN